ncbi:helix-turn-helix transcriptional regulator [Paenibacillus silvae]|uniref:AraC family transcriptional regulator n=1 Tax=Paenibacillus silvae TaxID=1325358 RepID=A0A2W6NZP8_9BACL|nr:AraC family transcriptional regulator [Paenibacillus silvae]PZT52880.1 AraC family transcriptional regulator [Paenibacillus silvae]
MQGFTDEHLEFICTVAHHLYNVPLYYFGEHNQLLHRIPVDIEHNPLFSSDHEMIAALFDGTEDRRYPIIRETVYLEKFFAINLFVDDQRRGRLVAGPVIHFKMTEAIIHVTLSDLLTKANNKELSVYYDHVPVMSNYKFINFAMVVYFMLYQEQLTLADVLGNLEKDDWRKAALEIEHPYHQIMDARQNNLIHTEMHKEKKLLDFIRLGRTDKVLETFHSIHKQGKKSVLSKTSYVRSQKNLAISLITLATRAAVEGGVFQEIAYNLSDLYILKLEELTDSKAVDDLMEDALLDFTKRVEHSKKNKYSKPINICQDYIFNHLHERITIARLAERTSLHPNYLSNLFKKEVGISISQFMLKTKIEEAQNLLTYSNYSLAEIATLLNFNDQSYFAKVFKTYTGCTPKQFKDQK